MVEIKYNGKETRGKWTSRELAQDFIWEIKKVVYKTNIYKILFNDEVVGESKTEKKAKEDMAYLKANLTEGAKWEIKKVVYKTNIYKILFNDEVVGESKTEKKAKEDMAYLKAHSNEIYE